MHSHRTCRRLTALLAAIILLLPVVIAAVAAARPPYGDDPYSPKIDAASDEAEKAIKKFRAPDGFKVELFAAEPMLANPVAFTFDERGRCYVAETFRLHDGVTDTRGHMNWLDDDLACRTIEDRVAMYRKYLGKEFEKYSKHHDRVRLIEDSDGDGRADRSTVFADGFNEPATGIGAGVLARGDRVWYACIPDLWLLRDTKGAGKADERKSLHRGYGVHVGFLGHDLHGLKFGPDGKLYFSIGDRGLNVETDGRRLFHPDSGAVLRCNADGSDLEIFATGLRNPQELAFDDYGNLFTCDNNSDSGDKARWTYLVEGGDSGWRIGYQFIEQPIARGPWNAEKLWHPPSEVGDALAAYIVPPIANLADGPSGLAFYPGVGLPDRYRRHFFLADFRGSSGQSGVRTFANRPRGASFELVESEQFLWGVLATDVEFGPDSGLYVSDWVEGWEKPHKGRIYRAFDPTRSDDAGVLESKQLRAEGMSKRPIDELLKLLGHADQRVRQDAQFELAARGEPAIEKLAAVARSNESQLARIHAMWALGQQRRGLPAAAKALVALLGDRDDEVRAQAAKLCGEVRAGLAFDGLVGLLDDANPRVRFFAAMSLGKLGRKQTVPAVLAMLAKNADADPLLRHAGVMALTWINDFDSLAAAAKHESKSVRLGALLAMRRLERPEVAQFLNDADPPLVLEAARAINDVPISTAMPALAKLIERPELPDRVAVRVLNANFRLGDSEHALAVADFATLPTAPESQRVEALRELIDWERPSGRDRVVGLWRPVDATVDRALPREIADSVIKLLSNSPESIQQLAVELAGRSAIDGTTPVLVQLAGDAKRPPKVRVAALRALELRRAPELADAVKRAVADANVAVRVEGRKQLAKLSPAEAIPLLESVLDGGSTGERQGALAALAGLQGDAVDSALARWLDELVAGNVPPEIQLDLLEAAAKRSAAPVKERLAKFEAARTKSNPLDAHRECLAGGDAERGGKIFRERSDAQCLKCHKIKGEGGEVGPDLFGSGSKQNREYILEAIVDPNKQIAKGFESVVLALDSGQIVTGVLKKETGDTLELITADAKLITVKKSDIEERKSGPSAMPTDILKHLSKWDLRDLVEFLSSLKDK